METPMDSVNLELRETGDRRTLGWRTVAYGFVLSRRRRHRRSAEVDVIFLDWHPPWLFFLAVGTTFLTLQLIERGMSEINPAMDALLGFGTSTFATVKLALTACGIFVLVFLAKFHFLNRFRTGLFLTVFFSFYATLVCYELVSLFNLL